MVNDVDKVHVKLQKSKDGIQEIQEHMKNSHGVLNDLEQAENVDSTFREEVQNAKDELDSIMAEKAVTDKNTDEVIELQKIAITSWLTMLDDNIMLQKNISLVQFLSLLEIRVGEHVKEGIKEDLSETIQITSQVSYISRNLLCVM